MSKFIKSAIIVASISMLTALPAHAYRDAPDTVAGLYAGTFICSAGEMGMTLSLSDISQAEVEAILSCRSGAGICNDMQKTRQVTGVINFFPTAGNPSAADGAFAVSGSIKKLTKKHTRLELEPGDWIEKPDNFGSSGLNATMYRDKISGKPTASGCHTLKMTRVK